MWLFHPSDALSDAQAGASPEREHWAAASQEEVSSHVLLNTYGDPVLLRGRTTLTPALSTRQKQMELKLLRGTKLD